jgi:hypothetical protein
MKENAMLTKIREAFLSDKTQKLISLKNKHFSCSELNKSVLSAVFFWSSFIHNLPLDAFLVNL